ncbi:hypothetical protein ENSA5_22700 [Enhygromyxa salina]|uniref:Glycosyl transferases group 1 n=1 Tax=Enhygromyxa salina TaxID=215803 RepID=A0A2S9YBL8_9BACT|nr:hypothetical protein [Enhygromyxa salina]PRQ02452.1 hypothetical protein ENSA5_22700 [Enhygromyxa salina]
MNILFVMEHRCNAGNTHALVNYMRVGAALGHTIAFFGEPCADLPGVNFSTDVGAFDRVVYLFESRIYRVKRLAEVNLLANVPRAHRFVLDADAKCNPITVVDDYDRNYANETQRSEWLRFYEALSDNILKPTLLPSDDERVTTLPFFGYDPALLIPPEAAPPKRYDVLYVGHNWWRWKELEDEILPGLEQIRDEIGEIGFAGLWWDSPPSECAGMSELEPAFRVNQAAFQKLRIHTDPAVPYTEVIRTMSTGRVNIFLQRPFLQHVRHLTLRYFEEFCADTIPLLMLDTEFAVAVYGPAARELTLAGRVASKVLDALRRPDHYREVVEDVRRHLLAHHPYEKRVEELVSVLRG